MYLPADFQAMLENDQIIRVNISRGEPDTNIVETDIDVLTLIGNDHDYEGIVSFKHKNMCYLVGTMSAFYIYSIVKSDKYYFKNAMQAAYQKSEKNDERFIKDLAPFYTPKNILKIRELIKHEASIDHLISHFKEDVDNFNHGLSQVVLIE